MWPKKHSDRREVEEVSFEWNLKIIFDLCRGIVIPHYLEWNISLSDRVYFICPNAYWRRANVITSFERFFYRWRHDVESTNKTPPLMTTTKNQRNTTFYECFRKTSCCCATSSCIMNLKLPGFYYFWKIHFVKCKEHNTRIDTYQISDNMLFLKFDISIE